MSRYRHADYLQGTRCTVETGGGSFCDADGAPDMPFAICARHAITLYRRMHEMVTAVQGKHREYPELHDAVVHAAAEASHAKANTVYHQVYYVLIGDLIKIGMTAHLDRRMGHYPPDAELLATERGGLYLETKRKAQFGHLLAHRREWFRPGPDLMDHIATLNETQRSGAAR